MRNFTIPEKGLEKNKWDITQTKSPSKTIFYNEGYFSNLMSNVQKKIRNLIILMLTETQSMKPLLMSCLRPSPKTSSIMLHVGKKSILFLEQDTKPESHAGASQGSNTYPWL